MEEAILSLLRDLGLNNYEAKTLYALFRLREADAKKVSEVAGVPRTKVYEILEKLAASGYVIVKDTRPKRYASKDPSAVIRKMISEKKAFLEKVEKRAEQVKQILPVLSESKEERYNYVVKFRDLEDLIGMLREELSKDALVVHTPESEYVLSRLKRRMVRGNVDLVVDRDRAYLFLHPIHEPLREITLIVFLEEPYVDIFKRWVDERSRAGAKVGVKKRSRS